MPTLPSSPFLDRPSVARPKGALVSDRVALLVHYTTRHVRAIVGALALSLCAVALGPLQALSLGRTIDSFTDERVDLAATTVLCLAMVGAALANSVANYLQSKIGNQVLLDLRRDLLAASTTVTPGGCAPAPPASWCRSTT